jgi:hypothetical protein
MCEPCPIRCTACSNATKCITCITGYMLSNSYQCIPNTTNDNNWVGKNVSVTLVSPSLVGIAPLVVIQGGVPVNITQNNLATYSTTYNAFPGSTWLGGYQMFGYQTKIVKTIYGLPPHGWINIRFQALIIDKWLGYTLLLELNQVKNYEPDSLTLPQQLWAGKFNSSLRFWDFAGNTTIYDNMAVADGWGYHNSSLVKFQIRYNESEQSYAAGDPIFQSFLAVKEIFVRVGSCGRNCLNCTGPTNCLYCYPPYVAVNGVCSCNASLGLGFPTRTGCSFNCVAGEYYNATALACLDCDESFPNCYSCDSSTCFSCKMGFFLYTDKNNLTTCVKFCPSNWTEARVSTTSANVTTAGSICVACAQNCSTCILNICVFCVSGFYYKEGTCVSSCSDGYYGAGGVCSKCPLNCLTCTASSCQSCLSGLTLTSNGICQPACDSGSSSCNFTCDAACASCFGPSSTQCLSCPSIYVLSGARCLLNCPLGQFVSQVANICETCAYGCSACTNSQCITCTAGYFLSPIDSSCSRVCPSSYYPSLTNNMCLKCS